MKKLLFVSALALLLLVLVIPMVSASGDYDDPALCVNGTWLLVDAAAPAGINVTVPDDARYGDQTAGGCATPSPVLQKITNVTEGESENLMKVVVDGSQASTPTITVIYGSDVQTKKNTGHSMTFTLHIR